MADSVFKKREIRLGIPAAGVFFAGRLTAGNLRAFLLLLDMPSKARQRRRDANSQSPKNVHQIRGRRGMLKSVDPILNADVLYALRAMGHGDDLVLCDMNFPADAVARQSVLGRLLRIDNVTAGRAARAILSVLPLDSFVDKPALRMEIVDKPDEVPPVQIEVQREIDAAHGVPLSMGSIERFSFYDLAKKSYCVIQTGERRFYGCFVFKKGVIAPDAA
jgi:L-fucose mutarotase